MTHYFKSKQFLIWKTFLSVPFLSFIIAMLLYTLTFQACTKNEPAPGEKGSTLIPSCDDPLTGNSVLELIRTPDDPVNDRINMMLYHYAQAIRILALNPTQLCLMETAMIADTGTVGVSLYSLAQSNFEFGIALNNALRQSMMQNEIYPRGEVVGVEASIFTPGWDANSFLRERMDNAQYKYDPVVYFVKRPEQCISNRLPTVVIAQDVNDCDDVAGWRGANEVLVSEAETNTSSDPIIFVGPGLGVYHSDKLTGMLNEVVIEDAGNTLVDIAPNTGQGATDRANIDINATGYQIKAGYRYESGNKSEIKGWRIVFLYEQENPYFTSSWQGDFDPMKISKGDINNSTMFLDEKNAFEMGQTEYDNDYALFIGTYEYDWWATKKKVNNDHSDFDAHKASVKMKYNNEWYFVYAGIANSIFTGVNSTWTIFNPKCYFSFKRNQ